MLSSETIREENFVIDMDEASQLHISFDVKTDCAFYSLIDLDSLEKRKISCYYTATHRAIKQIPIDVADGVPAEIVPVCFDGRVIAIKHSHLQSPEVKRLLRFWLKPLWSPNEARIVVMKTVPFDSLTRDGYPSKPDISSVTYILGIMAICIEDNDAPKINTALSDGSVVLHSKLGQLKFNPREAVWLGIRDTAIGKLLIFLARKRHYGYIIC